MAPENRKVTAPEEYTYEELLLLSDFLEKDGEELLLSVGLKSYLIGRKNTLFKQDYHTLTVSDILTKVTNAGYLPSTIQMPASRCAELPFNKMPLHIHHTNKFFSAVARWRLNVGR